MTGRPYVGTSGFAYPEWKGAFYPDDLRQDAMLPFYASRFPTVEINYTFRRFPSETTLTRWAELAPDGFRFGLKANRRITHTRRLRGAEADVEEFLQRARLLGDHLGPILFQCPPTLAFDRDLIEGFLGSLPDGLTYAMEFRHASWSEARDMLAARDVAWCVAETETQQVDREALPSGGLVYLRLRREDYTEEDLAVWARSIRGALEDGRDVFAYFKHEDKASAPRYAARLRELLG